MRYPGQHPRRATVVGAGSFGPAVAVLLERAGIRTTLRGRTRESVPYLAKASAANPSDTILSQTVAVLQAWFV